MADTSSCNSTEHLCRYKKYILSGISQVYDFCRNNEKFDEYTYIQLWRPVEWIIDYAVLEKFIQEKKDASEDEIANFIKEYNKKSVDKKFAVVKKTENPKGTLALLKQKHEEIDSLRRWRNGVVYHYIKENGKKPFKYFDIICEAFVTSTCSEKTYTRVSSLNREITLSEFARIYNLNIEQTYTRLKNIVDYLNAPNHDRIISICKMEELAQLIAYKILTIDFGKEIKYEKDGKKGIYVGINKVSSYIDSLTNEVSERNRLSFKKISQDLQQLRDTRNMAIHVLNVTEDMETDFRSVWLMTMNNYFGYDEKINNLLEAELLKVNWQNSLKNLIRYSDYYKNEKTRQIIVSIQKSVSLAIDALNAASDIYYKYSAKFNELPKADSNDEDSDLYSIMSTEIIKSFDNILSAIDTETKAKYKTLAIEKFGAKYNDNQNAYQCLETAMLLHETVGNFSSDYAGICIELTRALEIYLYNKISIKLKAYLQNNPTVTIDRKAKTNINNDKTTLGNYAHLYTGHNDSYSQAFFNFCKSESIYLETDDVKLKDELLQEMYMIGEIADNYRNKIAHREIVNETDMLNCKDDILDGGGPIVLAAANTGSTSTPEDNYALLKRISVKMGDIQP